MALGCLQKRGNPKGSLYVQHIIYRSWLVANAENMFRAENVLSDLWQMSCYSRVIPAEGHTGSVPSPALTQASALMEGKMCLSGMTRDGQDAGLEHNVLVSCISH